MSIFKVNHTFLYVIVILFSNKITCKINLRVTNVYFLLSVTMHCRIKKGKNTCLKASHTGLC